MAWQAIPSKGFFVELADTQTAEYKHVFCGQHNIQGAWCPNCDKPLLRFFTLDLTDPLLGLKRPGEPLSLMYCWTCGVAQADFYYECCADNGIAILSCGKGEHTPDFPYADYPEHFPQKHARLIPIQKTMQQQIIRQNADKISITYCGMGAMPIPDRDVATNCGNDLDSDQANAQADGLTPPKHQVGGQPHLLDTYWRMRCPLCGKRMSFLASIGDYSGIEIGFTGNPFVQVLYHYCRACRCVGAYQQTD